MYSANLTILTLAGILLGLFFVLKPAQTIEIQRRFYEKINWRIEPISMTKEVRNTRIMGLFLTISALLAAAYIVVRF